MAVLAFVLCLGSVGAVEQDMVDLVPGMIRAFAATTRDTVEAARQAHDTSPVATAALGRLMTGAVMMGYDMKNDPDLLTLRINCDGPIGGLLVTADRAGHVKGYVHNPDVMLPPNSKGKLDVGGALHLGILSVIRDTGLKEPYIGETILVSGEIAEDLTYYFANSEQVPSSVALGVLMNKDNTVRQAGGFIIQLMPGASDEIIDVLEGRGAEFVLDISHPCLAHLIERGPLLIKPNDEELGQIFGIGVADESEIPDALREICSRGAKNVLLTMGGNGAFFTDGEKVWRASAVKVDVLSATCAGDATLAAFLSRWFASRETVEASLRRAMATGANVAMCAGLGDFALVDELEGRVAIERIAWNPSRLAHGDQQ